MLALEALGWILADGDRAARMLNLTGLTPRYIAERRDRNCNPSCNSRLFGGA
ncbi:MAG: DUF3572 family protein [Sphingomonadales bacterium]